MDSTPLNLLTIDVQPQAVGGVLCARMSGDVDISNAEDLAAASPRIRGPGAHTVLLDIGPVTFFGSTLVNFLVHLVNAAPGSRIVLCRPSPMARRVVSALPLPSQISLRADLPPEWVEPAFRAGRPGPARSAGHGVGQREVGTQTVEPAR